jgi:hypothetical protein
VGLRFLVVPCTERVKWVEKTLMPWLHAQIAIEKVDMARVEQEELEEM